MARGSLGRSVPSAATDTVLFTATINCTHVDFDLFITNPNAADATISVAISSNDGIADANEYIESGTVIPTKGTHEIIARKMSPGDRVIIRSDKADTVFRIEGAEEVIY